MAALEIETKQVQVKNGDLSIDAYLASPTGEGPFPGIIVIQEIFGVNDHIRDVARRIAQEGYVAIAPAMYQRQAPGFETGYTPDDLTLGRVYKNQTKAAEILSDLEGTIDYLYSLPQVRPEGVGTIGFCFGGHVVYLGAVLDEVKATACFYGGGITTWSPGETTPTLSRTKDIKGTLYGFFGTQDEYIPIEEVHQIEAELKKHQIKHKIFIYEGAEHGFFCDQRSNYNPQAASDAWTHVLELFKTILNQ